MSISSMIFQPGKAILLLAVIYGMTGCVGQGKDDDVVEYNPDTSVDTDDGPRVVEKPIPYDTEVNPNASFQYNFDGLPFVGVNLSGPEWDGGASTTKWPNQYLTKNSKSEGYESFLQYFRGWGMTTVRLPFKWEYLQPELGGPLDAEELNQLKITVFHHRTYRAKILIDMHNYARFRGELIGSAAVSYDDYANAWARIANHFKDYPEVLFGIMNEPYGMSTQQWVDGANAAIKAIRDTGAKNLIFINGNGWSGAHSWHDTWPDSERTLSNADAMLQIVDPLGDDYLIFEVHQYLNVDSSDWGICECSEWEASKGCTPETVGSYRMKNFTEWLHENNKKGFLGEFGVQDDAVCLAAADDMLNHIEENDDVYVGWTWWSAGPGCSSWQDPIDPFCWGTEVRQDLLDNGVDGSKVYAQPKLLKKHLDRY